ncbi:MAG: NUDIX domain-containing protein [Nitrospiraceae bacterium]
MAKTLSAGILLYRRRQEGLQVLLVHPGGPFWSKKDDGAWSIPKGEYHEGDDALAAAKREFHEETGSEVNGPFCALSPLKQPSGKVVSVWAVEGDVDETGLNSNTVSMEWPPRSGTMQEFPEVDRGAWYDLATARTKLQQGQRGFLDQLQQLLNETVSTPPHR